MGRISDRLHRATIQERRTDDSTTTPSDGAQRMLPYSCCREFLTSHSLVTTFRMNASEVYDAIVHLDSSLNGASKAISLSSTTEDTVQEELDDFEESVWEVFDRPRTNVAKHTSHCIECKSVRIFLDDRNGCEVCEDCGIVQTRGSLNITPEFVKEVDDLPRKRRRGIQGVSHWIAQQLYTMGDAKRNPTYMDDLEHMNAYVNLCIEDLRLCERRLQQWSSGHVSRDMKIAAVLLYPSLQERFMTVGDVRRCVRTIVQHAGTEERKGRHVPTWHMSGASLSECPRDVVPPPTHPCVDCGVLHYSKKAARYHCKHANKYARV